jgi:hypothetical protein
MSEANVVTTAANTLWYTDRVEIVTNATPVTYQVYATALRDQLAVGNIYSEPSTVNAYTSEEVYVGVGNYLTVTGSDWSGTEIGGQTSAQAGVGGYGINNLPTPPAPLIPTVASVTPARGPQTGRTAITITGTNFVSVTGVTIGLVAATNVAVANSTTLTAVTANSPSGTYTVNVTNTVGTSNSSISFDSVPTTPVYAGIGSGDGTGRFANVGTSFPSMANVAAGWTVNYSNGAATGWIVVGFGGNPAPPGFVNLAIDTGSFPTGNYTFTAPQSLAGNVTPYYNTRGGTGSSPQFASVFGPYPSLNNVAAGWLAYTPTVGGGTSAIGTVTSTTDNGTFVIVNSTAPSSPRYASYRFGTF